MFSFLGEMKVASLFTNLTELKIQMNDKGIDLTLGEFLHLANASVDFQKV